MRKKNCGARAGRWVRRRLAHAHAQALGALSASRAAARPRKRERCGGGLARGKGRWVARARQATLVRAQEEERGLVGCDARLERAQTVARQKGSAGLAHTTEGRRPGC